MTRVRIPDAFWEHARAVQEGRTAGRGRAAGPAMPVVDPASVGWFRARAMHLAERLPDGALATGAAGGLQDTAPRAALVALGARVGGVGPDGWEHPDLVQIWFRQADYVVPRADVGVFTRGAMPRDPGRAAALERVADAIAGMLAGEGRTTRALTPALPEVRGDHWVRLAAVTGRLHIRWDARTVVVWAVDAAPGDDEAARTELARRFLRWLGPADDRQFARWAGVSRDDAAETWRRLGDELVPMSVAGRARSLLAADEPALRGAAPGEGVRFLPLFDPWLYPDPAPVVPAPPPRVAGREPGPGISRRLLNSLAGRILVDGAVVASWGRAGARLAIAPWGDVDRGRMREEIEVLGATLDRALTVRWLDP